MKTVLITGTSRGVGQALAMKFLQEGWQVVGTSTSGKSPIEDSKFKCFKLDLTRPLEIDKTAKKITSIYPKIDILVNNAGVSLETEYNKPINIKQLRDTFEVNVFGFVDFTEHLLPYIKDGGQIVNISSRYGNFNLTIEYDGPAYSMSKAAVNMYTLKLSRSLEKRHIAVFAIHPGWVKTDMGGPDADLEPYQAADQIFSLIMSKPSSGHFLFEGKISDW